MYWVSDIIKFLVFLFDYEYKYDRDVEGLGFVLWYMIIIIFKVEFLFIKFIFYWEKNDVR